MPPSPPASEPRGSVTLICPGLLGPLPLLPEPLPGTPLLDRWLARGRRVGGAPQDPHLACLNAVGVSTETERDPPTGAISLLGEASDAARDGFWMHADPVHLRPDRDQLLVFAGEALAPAPDEAQALVDAFNAHFVDDGLLLVAPAPGRWYLRSGSALELRTTPLHEVLGGPMDVHLPEGADAAGWMRLMNEAQMLFHAHPVNQRRERQGRPMINGLWTWGMGRLPTVPAARDAVLIGDHPLIAGLARLVGGRHLASSRLQDVSIGHGEDLLVFFGALGTALRRQELAAWVAALVELEAQVAGLDSQTRRGEIARVELEPCLGTRWLISAGRLRWLWRRGGLARWVQIGRGG